jgi:hypothetical protein
VHMTRVTSILMNEKVEFKVALKRYLNTHSFYSVDEFLSSKNDSKGSCTKCKLTVLIYMCVYVFLECFRCTVYVFVFV